MLEAEEAHEDLHQMNQSWLEDEEGGEGEEGEEGEEGNKTSVIEGGQSNVLEDTDQNKKRKRGDNNSKWKINKGSPTNKKITYYAEKTVR